MFFAAAPARAETPAQPQSAEAPAAARASGTSNADLVASALAKLTELQAALPAVQEEYEKLNGLRLQLDPYRDGLRARLATMEPRRAALAQQVAQIGPQPSGAEAPEHLALRQNVARAQSAFEADYRHVATALQQCDQFWTSLTHMRRQIFSTRLLMHVSSIVDPRFWIDFVTFQTPGLFARSKEAAGRWRDYVEEDDSEWTFFGLIAGVIATVAAFFWLHRLIARRARRLDRVEVTEGAAVRHAATLFVMRTVPLASAMLLFNFAIRWLDAAPPDFDALLAAVAVGLLVIGAARGSMGALLSPHAPRWRLIRASDDMAETVYAMVVRAVDLYTIGIVFTTFQRLIEARVQVAEATIMILTTAMIAVGLHGLRRMDRAAGEAHGFVEANLHWTRPIVALACIVCTGAMIFGYIALAGFVSGRVVISAGAIATALLIVTILDHVFDKNQPSQTRFGGRVARSLGVSGATLDLLGTAISGIIRFAVIVTAGLIVFMPWGLEYGDVNPFADFANFVTTTDLHNWLGSVGFALLAFVVGLLGTRIIVGWLDSSLLPRTNLDWSLRHSVRTVLGYTGFAATALVALSLLGINAQNVAVVAGALSVGIGFGLQSIVSNFVSGLIVLAERPVRVGDVIVVKGEEGRVERISVRATQIATFERSSLIVPNSDLITSIVRNRTLTDPTQQLRFNLTLEHDTDPREARATVLELAKAHPNALKDPPSRMLFMRATEFGQEYEVRVNVDSFDNMVQVRSDLHDQIVLTFREKGLRLARLPAGLSSVAAGVARVLPPSSPR
jgi:small-conductance mechanosensitive channel